MSKFILTTLFLTACAGSDNSPSPRMILQSIKPQNTNFISGIVRCYSETDCRLLIDEDHDVVGATGASVVDGSLFVFFPATKKIITFLILPDETLAQENVTCGASVGLDRARIECANQTKHFGPEGLALPGANLFFFAVLSGGTP